MLYNLSAVPLQMMYEGEINKGNAMTREDALFILQKASEVSVVNIMATRGICLKSVFQTRVKVSSKAASLVEILWHGNVLI